MGIQALLPNDLPFSSERQGRVRAYHGREEPRAQPAASRHEPTSERTRVAFDCCNGLFGSDHRWSISNAAALAPRTIAALTNSHSLVVQR